MPTATACMTGTGYLRTGSAQDPADCGTGMQCCSNATAVIQADTDGQGGPTCPMGHNASKMTGTSCMASCGTGIIMCTSDAECVAAGKTTCQPFRKAGASVGGCM